MLRDRLLTAAVAIPLLILLICCAPVWGFSGAIFLLTCVGLYEFFRLSQNYSPLPLGVGLGWGGALAAAMLLASDGLGVRAACAGAVLVGGFFVAFGFSLRDRQPERGVFGLALTLFGVVYVGFLLPHLVWVRQAADGRSWVFFILLVAMMGDSGGYAFGRAWGTHKLIPHISPGKTVEGSAGAVLGNLCAAVIGWIWLLPDRAWGELVILSLILGCLAQIGDLCESAVKRAFGAKDSGRLFPGHGGVLDRADSLLFPAAFVYYYVTLWP